MIAVMSADSSKELCTTLPWIQQKGTELPKNMKGEPDSPIESWTTRPSTWEFL